LLCLRFFFRHQIQFRFSKLEIPIKRDRQRPDISKQDRLISRVRREQPDTHC
jgi:hypothetical protein